MASEKKLKKNQSTDLNIKLATDLLLQFKDIKGFFPSYLIGMKPGVFLIIKTPTIITKEKILSRGSSLMVRHTHLGDVYRFKTKVIGTNQKPFKVTYLSYPDVVEKIEFRDSQRVHCFFPATLAYNDMQVKGMVSDISLGGCKFRTDDIEQVEGLVLKKEGSVTVRFPLLGLDGIRAFDGKIKKIEFDVSFSLGIGFRDLDEPSSGVITSYIESAREYHI